MSAKKFTIIALILLSVIGLWMYRDQIMEMLQWFADPAAVTKSIQGYGIWGPVILFILFILQTFFAFIPGQALMVASGYIYGFTGGLLITWTSLVVGGQAAFWLARRYGRPFAEYWISAPILDRWDKSAAGQGVGFYIITLIMPFFPNDAMCYVAGLGNMSHRRFLVANTIGRGIASLFTVLIGAFSEQLPSLIWVGVGIFIVLGAVGWFFAQRYNKLAQQKT